MKPRSQKGAAAVEFALLLPLLLAIFAGMVEMGLLLYDQQVITNASREGARAGIVQDSTIDVDSIVHNYCDKNLYNLKEGDSSNTVVIHSNRGAFQSNYTVTVQYDYRFFLPQFFGFDLERILVAHTTMKMEDVQGPP